MNVKQVVELMNKAGWTAQQFADSLNSAIRMEAHSRKYNRGPGNKGPVATVTVTSVTVEDAARFLKDGSGIDGAAYDILERWAERRMGYSNAGVNGVSGPGSRGAGMVFDKPPMRVGLSKVSPPVLLGGDGGYDLARNGPDIRFGDVSNARARQKLAEQLRVRT